MMRRAGELPRVLAKHLLDGSDPGRQTEALKGVVHSLPKQSSPKVRLLDAASPFAGSGRLRSLSHRHPCVTTGSRHPKCPAHDVSCARSFVITMSSLHQFTRCFSAYQRNPYGWCRTDCGHSFARAATAYRRRFDFRLGGPSGRRAVARSVSAGRPRRRAIGKKHRRGGFPPTYYSGG
jgi:hypothetical protein